MVRVTHATPVYTPCERAHLADSRIDCVGLFVWNANWDLCGCPDHTAHAPRTKMNWSTTLPRDYHDGSALHLANAHSQSKLVFMHELGISQSRHPLATHGIRSCSSLCFWVPAKGVYGLAHVSPGVGSVSLTSRAGVLDYEEVMATIVEDLVDHQLKVVPNSCLLLDILHGACRSVLWEHVCAPLVVKVLAAEPVRHQQRRRQLSVDRRVYIGSRIRLFVRIKTRRRNLRTNARNANSG